MTLVKFQPAPFKTIFDELRNAPSQGFQPTQPPVNILETPTGFRLEIAAPGLTKEDFQVKVEKNVLTISANKEMKAVADGATYRRREFAYCVFDRSFRLPETIDTDQVKAGFANGILNVDLVQKPELQPVVKTVEIA